MIVDEIDLIAGVRLLENEPLVQSWSISKITNPHHMLRPFGQGFGLTVYHGVEPHVIFEKELTLVEAATRAIDRLRALIEQAGTE